MPPHVDVDRLEVGRCTPLSPFGSLPSRQALPNRLRGHRIVTTQPVDGCSGTSPVASGVLVTTAFLRTAITMTSRIPAWDRRSDV